MPCALRMGSAWGQERLGVGVHCWGTDKGSVASWEAGKWCGVGDWERKARDSFRPGVLQNLTPSRWEDAAQLPPPGARLRRSRGPRRFSLSWAVLGEINHQDSMQKNDMN